MVSFKRCFGRYTLVAGNCQLSAWVTPDPTGTSMFLQWEPSTTIFSTIGTCPVILGGFMISGSREGLAQAFLLIEAVLDIQGTFSGALYQVVFKAKGEEADSYPCVAGACPGPWLCVVLPRCTASCSRAVPLQGRSHWLPFCLSQWKGPHGWPCFLLSPLSAPAGATLLR